ncbi:transcriptional regulator [Haloplanus rallus]|uniref:Transcriptional regulator n=1 Tax=Haloplanus rallus TaxID=1816183 RepID=A0A6B9FDV3_9EURY|nr:transcriptional regulator [Haloplanus rallus]QGX94790.1 transcriptional regulator [Haloplanus rallus]
MTDDTHRDGPPPFDRPFDDEDTKQRVYGAILHAREPMTAAEIAERADCSTESARTHLAFYADLGIVIHHDGRPARYERNDDYFKWRRVNKLAHDHTVEELQARVSELTNQIESYRDEYDADSPADVNVLAYDAEAVDDVYADLGAWATAIEERRFHERARQKATGSTAPSHS